MPYPYAINGRIFVKSDDLSFAKWAYTLIRNYLWDEHVTLKKEPTESAANKNMVFSPISGVTTPYYEDFLTKIDELSDRYKPFTVNLKMYQYKIGGDIELLTIEAQYEEKTPVNIQVKKEDSFKPTTHNLQTLLKLEGAINLNEDDSLLPYLKEFAKNQLTSMSMYKSQQKLLKLVEDVQKIQEISQKTNGINKTFKYHVKDESICLTYARFYKDFYKDTLIKSFEEIRRQNIALLIENEVGDKLEIFKRNYNILKEQYQTLEEFIDTSEYISQIYKEKIFKEEKTLPRMEALIEFIEKELPYK